jgi:hypothetical protein
MEIAKLGLVIDPSGAVKGKDAGVKAAEALAAAMERAADRIERATSKMGESAQKGGEQAAKGAEKADKALDQLGKNKGFSNLANQAKQAGAGVASSFGQMVQAAAMMRGGVTGAIAGIGSAFSSLVSQVGQVAKSVWEAGKSGTGLRAIGAGAKAAAVGIGALTVATGALLAILLPLVAAGVALHSAFTLIADGVNLSADFETYEIQFANLLGSFEKAEERMKSLADFANSTPFELPEVAKASITLEAMGRGALSGEESLRMVGDAAAKANVPFDELGVTVGRLYANLKAGATAGVELNRLSDIGLLAPDVKLALMELSESANEGGKNFAKLWAMVESELQKAKGSTQLMALSFKGLVSTMGDSWNELKRTIGEPFRDALKPLVGDLTGLIDQLTAKALALQPAIRAALDEVVLAVRVMEQDGGLGVALEAGIDTAMQVLERGLTAAGEVAKDVMNRAGWELVNQLEKLNSSGFWKGLQDTLYNAAAEFVNVMIRGVNEVAANANTIAKVLSPAYALASAASGTGPPKMAEIATKKIEALALGEKPGIRSFGDVYGAMPDAPQTAAQAEYAARRQKEAERLAAERAAGRDDTLVAPGAPTAIPTDLLAQVQKKKSGGGGGQSEFDKMKGEAERVISDIATPQEELDKQLASLSKLKDAGLLTADQFQRAVEKSKTDYVEAMGQMAKASEDAAKRNQTALQRLLSDWGNLRKQVDEASVGMANSLADNLTTGLVAMMDGTKSAKEAFADMAKSIVADILQITMRLMVQYAIQSALGMVVGTPSVPVAVPVAHDGGEVGSVRRTRAVGAGAFVGAMRYHTGGQVGLKPGEEPAILEKGETVLSKEDTAAMKKRLAGDTSQPTNQQQGQGVTIVNVVDPRQVEEYLATNPNAILNVMAKNSGTIRRMLATT